MDRMQLIIAATDFSEDSHRAVRRATLLAAEHKAALTLVHVVEVDRITTLRDWLDDARDIRAAIVEQARMQLSATSGQLAAANGITVTPQVLSGNVQGELEQAASTADLLVLGARGESGIRQLA